MKSLHDRIAFQDLLAALPVADVARDDLARRMRSPERFYHSDRHVGAMWSTHRLLAAEAGLEATDTQRRLACAVAFHDSVLQPGRTDNERRSAQFWLEASCNGQVSEDDRRAVADMIEATADHVGTAPWLGMNSGHRQEVCWLLDLDLSSLGAAPRVFNRNTADLRRESDHLNEREWQKSLIGFFSKLLGAEPLYRSRPIASRFDAAAQANMTNALERLCARLLDVA